MIWHASFVKRAAVAMATKLSDEEIGAIRRAMAYRVKYRVEVGKFGLKSPESESAVAGRTFKKRFHINIMGVHPRNRGGVYPNDSRCKGLGKKIALWGADQEEADHNGVCVEEIPAAEREKHKDLLKNLPTYQEWNVTNSSKCEMLRDCFAGSMVQVATLSHGHLLLILLCWAVGAKWDMRDDEGNPLYCDEQGNLLLSAVAEEDPVLVNLVERGLKMEVLSWRINIEEPDAASAISQALNKGQEAALQTSELTAVAVLNGRVGVELNAAVAAEVAFETVKQKVRKELDTFVDEPEFVEMFQAVFGGLNIYLINYVIMRFIYYS